MDDDCRWFDDHPEALGAAETPAHLAMCAPCRARASALEQVIRPGLAALAVPVPPVLERRIRAAAARSASRSLLPILMPVATALGLVSVAGSLRLRALERGHSDHVMAERTYPDSTGRGAPKPGPGGQGNRNPLPLHPVLSGEMSCEEARARYIEDYDKAAPPDLSAGAYVSVLANGKYLLGCGVPAIMSVNICAAVQNGHAVGVTVSTLPKEARVSSCVSAAVRGLSFPSHPRLDITTTTFAGL